MFNKFTIVAEQKDLVAALNDFNHNYHRGFFNVINQAKACLLESQCQHAVLAQSLRQVLIEWGAGKRKAPEVAEVEVLAAVLADSEFTSVCNQLLNASKTQYEQKMEFNLDDKVAWFLHFVAKNMFNGCTNVTYPMKVLLLLTGWMPAFDGQVKKGLSLAGLNGFATTSYPLGEVSEISMQRIQKLPMALVTVWTPELRNAIIDSHYPELLEYPGRVFDILFFMQGKEAAPLLIQHH